MALTTLFREFIPLHQVMYALIIQVRYNNIYTMKKLSILLFSLTLSLSAFAQQALWGGPQIVSPEINPNNSVTFRIMAPKAVKVQITGDFLPTQKMATPFGVFDAPGV